MCLRCISKGTLMKIIILAGGLGTRISEETVNKPKPMVPLSGKPILWHLMSIFSKQKYTEFVLALGYRKEVVQDWLHNFKNTENWLIDPLDTGLDTQTGGRIKKCLQKYPNQRVVVTYGDGLANISLNNLLDFHKSHKKIATVTAVRPPARFGHLSVHGDKVVRFGEKVQADEGWINGGFFVLEPEVIEMIDNDWDLFETGALPKLAMDNQLMAFKHEYFWKPMDTLREKNELEKLSLDEIPPWLDFSHF
jgi:glucose-1-phosphate cytidylyltransferase